MNNTTYPQMKDILKAYAYGASRMVIGSILVAYALGVISEKTLNPIKMINNIKTEQAPIMQDYIAKQGNLEKIAE